MKLFDTFGVNFQTPLSKKETELKTNIGGVVSIIVYSLTVIYLFYYIWKWQISNQLLPNYSTYNKLMDNVTYQFSENQIIIDIPQTFNGLNPLDPLRNIFYIQTLEQFNQQSQHGQPYSINSNQIIISNFTLQSGTDGNFLEQYYNFVICDSNQVSYGIICAPDEEIQNYLEQVQIVTITFTFNQFNQQQKKIETFQKIFKYFVSGAQVQLLNIEFQSVNYQIDSGILMESKENFKKLLSADIVGQTVPIQGVQLTYNKLFYLTLYLSISNQEIQQIINYVKLGTVLAEVGSIFSLLLVVGYLIKMINQKTLDQLLTDSIIIFYYPFFKSLKITRNWSGKIVRVQSKDNKTEYEIDKLQMIYQQSRLIARRKLSILNIIYELSRIQFILQSLQQRNVLIDSHQIGINLKIPQIKIIQESIDEYQQNETESQDEQIYLEEDDMGLLCIPQINNVIIEEIRIINQSSEISKSFESNSLQQNEILKINIGIQKKLQNKFRS